MDIEGEIDFLNKRIVDLANTQRREQTRTNRIVQVLIKNLPIDVLTRKISFQGYDCHGELRLWYKWYDDKTVYDFLKEIIDP